MSKEEHYEERKRLYNQFKTDNPQTIGETDKAFDNDNFIDWLVDNQNTKPLVDEIAKLKQDLKAAESVNEQYRIGLIEIKHSLTESRQKIIEAITNPI